MFGLMAIGFIFRKSISARFENIFVDIFIYTLFPLFILISVWQIEFSIKAGFYVGIVASTVVVFAMLVVYILSRILALDPRDYILPASFMNSALLGFPVIGSLVGEAVFPYLVFYNLVITLLHFTLGVFIVSGSGEFLKFPYLYTASIGFVLNFLDVKVPQVVTDFYRILKVIVFPPLLVYVGMKLSTARIKKATLYFSFVRFFAGIFSFIVLLLPLENRVKMMCVLVSSMPSAINTVIISQKFGRNPEGVVAVVLLTTLLSPFWLYTLYVILKLNLSFF